MDTDRDATGLGGSRGVREFGSLRQECRRPARGGRAGSLARRLPAVLGLSFGLCLGQGLVPAPSSAGVITGVCPDGSIYIVQRQAQIPCSNSKLVEPSEVPPVRPEYMPSPYSWQLWNQANNPNNPYNLIDPARELRGLQRGRAGAPGGGYPQPGQPGVQAPQAGPYGAPGYGQGMAPQSGLPQVSSAPPQAGPPPQAGFGAAPAGAVGALDLGLSEEELRDLYLIVHLSQEHVPATLGRETADGRGVFEVRLAHSAAFENRLHAAWTSRGGLDSKRVLLFTATARQPEDFWANLTFVQDHLTYQPDARNPRQIGILQGHLGQLEAGAVVLGYVVLPDTMSLAKSLDIYWNDRRARARFGG